MTYCRRCGTKLEDNMSYCPKCGYPAELQERNQSVRSQAQPISSLTIAVIAAVAAAAVIIVALIAVGLVPIGQLPIGYVVGSGNVQTQKETLSDFSVLDVSSGFKVQIMRSSTYGINITADDNLFEFIQVYKTGSTLTIRLKPGVILQTSVLKAQISMPDLKEAQFSGGVIGNASGFNLSHDFNVGLSGGSSLKMDGKAVDLVALCSGGATLEMSDFQVNNAKIDFSGGAKGTIKLDGRLDANLSGGAHLSYIGNPTLGTINTSGGASISKVD